MPQTKPSPAALKRAMKEALVETLQERGDLFRGVFAEVLEDYAIGEAIREGKKTGRARRADVFHALNGRS